MTALDSYRSTLEQDNADRRLPELDDTQLAAKRYFDLGWAYPVAAGNEAELAYWLGRLEAEVEPLLSGGEVRQ